MMIIINETRSTTLSKSAKLAESFFSRLRGLMFTKKPQTLVLVCPRQSVADSSIHMLFMRQAIDVIWLDSRFVVTDTCEAAKPWSPRIFKSKAPAKYVIECPVGTIVKTKTSLGDNFSFTTDN